MLEDKGVTLALHYRQAPAVEAEATALAEQLAEQANGAVIVLRGKKVLELKPPGIDKGRAVAAFLAEAPFAGQLPVFAGDDVTDEAGFAAVNERGGLSLRVGVDGRATQARHGLADVTAMHAWLATLAAAELALDG
jgi:trehalose 6-phosphate phosphatase